MGLCGKTEHYSKFVPKIQELSFWGIDFKVTLPFLILKLLLNKILTIKLSWQLCVLFSNSQNRKDQKTLTVIYHLGPLGIRRKFPKVFTECIHFLFSLKEAEAYKVNHCVKEHKAGVAQELSFSVWTSYHWPDWETRLSAWIPGTYLGPASEVSGVCITRKCIIAQIALYVNSRPQLAS